MKTKLWVIGATGFTESLKNPTGLEFLWRELRYLSQPDVIVVTPRAWKDDAAALARFIARNSDADDCGILFYGHSYGVGEFFKTFSRALKDLGFDIDVAVFADGIRRFKFIKLASFKWFHRAVKIRVPDNVALVHAFHQSNDLILHGHTVIAEDPSVTEVHMHDQPHHKHTNSDEDASFRKVVIGETQRLIREI